MVRLINFFLALLILIIFAIPMIIIAIIIRVTSKGPSIYWSNRVGKDNLIFKMPKFRTMLVDSPSVATHLMSKANLYLTPIGGFLRRSSLDELPQLFSILKGDMGFVGPRPALFNQDDLVKLRSENEVHKLLPGVTGWAQVNGRDELSIPEKVDLDIEYMNRRSFWFDLRILWMTLLKVVKSDGVSH